MISLGGRIGEVEPLARLRSLVARQDQAHRRVLVAQIETPRGVGRHAIDVAGSGRGSPAVQLDGGARLRDPLLRTTPATRTGWRSPVIHRRVPSRRGCFIASPCARSALVRAFDTSRSSRPRCRRNNRPQTTISPTTKATRSISRERLARGENEPCRGPLRLTTLRRPS